MIPIGDQKHFKASPAFDDQLRAKRAAGLDIFPSPHGGVAAQIAAGTTPAQKLKSAVDGAVSAFAADLSRQVPAEERRMRMDQVPAEVRRAAEAAGYGHSLALNELVGRVYRTSIREGGPVAITHSGLAAELGLATAAIEALLDTAVATGLLRRERSSFNGSTLRPLI